VKTDDGRVPVMADVARRAGVSNQTVSRVLNEHPSVRPDTRDRVVAAIRELGYRPNAAARTLVTRRTNMLGVICFNTTLYGPASMFYAIEQAAKQHDYFVVVAALAALDRRSVLEAVRRLCDQGVEGIIVIAPQATAVATLAHTPPDVPLIAVGCGTHAAMASVAVDNEAGAERATSYLLDLGHRTVHHLAGPRSWQDARERETGWRRALAVRGARVVDPCRGGDWSARTGFELGRRIIGGDGEVTGVFCANDHMALGLMRALQQAGRRVPEDVSVVGFDDIPEAEFFGPSLTTVRQDFDELGRRALASMMGLIGSARSSVPPAGATASIDAGLVVRSSAARPTR
jgi:DNA-binding LacI/PurR family transcriptional regulator